MDSQQDAMKPINFRPAARSDFPKFIAGRHKLHEVGQIIASAAASLAEARKKK